MGPRIRRWLKGGAWALAAGALFAFATVAWLSRDLPDPRPLREQAWVMRRFALQEWTPPEAVAPNALRAILLSEDDTFYQHQGLRLDELGSALWDDLTEFRFKRGASSITQQVVKNAFLGREKTLRRKATELLLARRADRLVGKARLLAAYLNLAEWGPQGQRGIAFASRRYLGKEPMQLNAADGALLAWLLPDPRGRAYWLKRGELPPLARRHIRRMLGRLVREERLSEPEASALAALPFPFERRAAPVVPVPTRGVEP